MTRRSLKSLNLEQIHPSKPSEEILSSALDVFREVVLARGLRMTQERAHILQMALEFPGHFDALSLSMVTLQRGRSISLRAIYPALVLLVEAGILRRTLFSQGNSQLYEVSFARPLHDHLVCRACGLTIEFHCGELEILRREAAAIHSFELSSYIHEMVGRCSTCVERSRR